VNYHHELSLLVFDTIPLSVRKISSHSSPFLKSISSQCSSMNFDRIKFCKFVYVATNQHLEPWHFWKVHQANSHLSRQSISNQLFEAQLSPLPHVFSPTSEKKEKTIW
jgi:hypothetical protein